jgi:hypothetical protein
MKKPTQSNGMGIDFGEFCAYGHIGRENMLADFPASYPHRYGINRLLFFAQSHEGDTFSFLFLFPDKDLTTLRPPL